MTKYRLFLKNLVTVLNRYDTTDIKVAIGDSTNNHRTVTVNQVIRFLGTRRNATLKALGLDLTVAYEAIRDDILATRSYTSRTDALDINEFIDTYSVVVIGGSDTSLRRSLSKQFIAA